MPDDDVTYPPMTELVTGGSLEDHFIDDGEAAAVEEAVIGVLLDQFPDATVEQLERELLNVLHPEAPPPTKPASDVVSRSGRRRSYEGGTGADARLMPDATDDNADLGQPANRVAFVHPAVANAHAIAAPSAVAPASTDRGSGAARADGDGLSEVLPIGGGGAASGRVSGTLVLDHGSPASAVKLRLYQRGLGGTKTLLGEGVTNDRGGYTIPYSVEGAANVEVYAVGADAAEVRLTEPTALPTAEKHLDLVAPGAVQPLAPEFTRLRAAVAPHTGNRPEALMDAVERGDRDDFSLLASATGWDPGALALASEAFRNETVTKIPAEGLYAMARAGVPMNARALAMVPQRTVARALRQAADDGIVDAGTVGDSLQAFTAFASDHRLNSRIEGAVSSPREFVDKSSLSDADRDKFIKVVRDETPIGIWERAEAAGVSDAGIRSLQLEGKLAYLTFNNADLTADLAGQISENPFELIELGYYNKAKWKDVLLELAGNNSDGLASLIPSVFAGNSDDEPTDAYADELARRVRQMSPHAVTVKRIATGEVDGVAERDNVGTFLRNATPLGFRLGQTPLSAFVKVNEAMVWNGIADGRRDDILKSIRALSALYAISPTDEALAALLVAGYTSATEIATHGYEAFAERLQGVLEPHQGVVDRETTEKIYWKAQQQSATVFNVFDGLKRLNFVSYAPGSAPEDVKKRDDQITRVRDKLAGLFPTLETLFGTVDYCECEHCRSVLSPAAYLVDLLHFIDPDNEAWASVKASYRARTGADYTKQKPFDSLNNRRPDIKNIALTCENTNVALPYIDIVNEILEQLMMADETAPAIEAYDVAEASSQDLIAEPQNIRWTAYVGSADKQGLRDLVYPATLPFDLPLETVRAFLGQLGLPLWRLRECVARPSALMPSAEGRTDGWTDVWFERLGLSAGDVASLTRAEQWHVLYGYASSADALKTDVTDGGTRPAKTSLRNAKTLARRLEISYEDLVELVRTRFINPEIENLIVLHRLGVDPDTVDRYLGDGKPLSASERTELEADLLAQQLQPADLRPLRTEAVRQNTLVLRAPSVGCDVAEMTLEFDQPPSDVDQSMALVLRKMNAFVRLRKRLGWETHELDRTLLALMPGVASLTMTTWPKAMKTSLIYLAHVVELRERFQDRLSREQILILWSDIPTQGVSSLYDRLFSTPAVLGHDAAFRKHLGRVLEDTAVQLGDHAAGVRQALQVAHDDIEPILRAAGAADRALSIKNLSILMRYAVLAKGLDLSIADLLALVSLSDRKPLSPLNGAPLDDLTHDVPWTETLAFVREVEIIREAKVDVAFINRICRSLGVPDEPPADKDPALITLLALPREDAAVPEKSQLILTQTLAAQLSVPETLIAYLLGEVLKDPAGNALKETGFADPMRAAGSLRKLRRTLDLIETLDISEDELAYLTRNPAALDPNDLPLTPVRDEATAKGLRRELTAWLELAVTRSRFGRGERLVPVLLAATQPLDETHTLADRQAHLADVVSALTGRTPTWLSAALKAVGATPTEDSTFEVPALAHPASLRQVLDALQCFTRVGLSPEQTAQLATLAIDETVAQEVRASVKSRYAPSAWRRLAKPIFDSLRKMQRDALVAHLTNVTDDSTPKYGDTIEQLFEYLLLDPAMEPAVLASRIQLAISSVQLFVQRCLMNLEQDTVDPRIIDGRRWEWMRRYRVWEVNRKMFIRPQVWLQPEFRDDKTHLFQELEGRLLEGDVDEDLVRTSFNTYLKGLEEIARLELLTMYFEPGVSADGAIIHVVGRTLSAPHKYFYRRASHGTWTPWEPIDVGIEGEHLVLTAWRGRMHLFWVSFLEQEQESLTIPQEITPGTDTVPLNDLRGTTAVKVQLHWVEHVQGKWVNRSSTPAYVDVRQFDGMKATTDADKRAFFVRATLVENSAGAGDDDLEIRITQKGRGIKFTFFSKLAPPSSRRVKPNYGAPPEPPEPPFAGQVRPEATKWIGSGALEARFVSAITRSSTGGTVRGAGGPHKVLGGNGRFSFSLLSPSNEYLPVPARTPPSGVGRPTGFVFGPQNAHHVVYRSSDGGIRDLFWAGNGWFHQSPGVDADISDPAAESEPAISDPHGYAVDERGMACIAYAGPTKLHELVWSQLDPALDDETRLATGWRIETLYQASGTADQPEGRPFGGLFLPRRGVVFRTKDGRLRAAVEGRTGGPWQVRELNAGWEAAASDPTGLLMTKTRLGVTTVVSRHVFYIGTDGDVHELRSDVGGENWSHANVTEPLARNGSTMSGASVRADGVVKPAPGSSLAAYAFLGQNTLHVVYRGVDDRIHELWGTPGEWHYNPIGAKSTKATGDPTGYVTESFGTQHVVYRGEDNHIVELWWSGTWREHILTTTVSSALPPRSDVAGYSFESSRTQHVVYFAEDGSPRELSWDTNGWQAGAYELENPFPDALGPLGSPFFYEASDKDHTFFVEPYVVETAVHEWTEWIITKREYMEPQLSDVALVALNPDAMPIAANEASLIKEAGQYSDAVFDKHAVVLTTRGAIGPQLMGESGSLVQGTLYADRTPLTVVDTRSGAVSEGFEARLVEGRLP